MCCSAGHPIGGGRAAPHYIRFRDSGECPLTLEVVALRESYKCRKSQRGPPSADLAYLPSRSQQRLDPRTSPHWRFLIISSRGVELCSWFLPTIFSVFQFTCSYFRSYESSTYLSAWAGVTFRSSIVKEIEFAQAVT